MRTFLIETSKGGVTSSAFVTVYAGASGFPEGFLDYSSRDACDLLAAEADASEDFDLVTVVELAEKSTASAYCLVSLIMEKARDAGVHVSQISNPEDGDDDDGDGEAVAA